MDEAPKKEKRFIDEVLASIEELVKLLPNLIELLRLEGNVDQDPDVAALSESMALKDSGNADDGFHLEHLTGLLSRLCELARMEKRKEQTQTQAYAKDLAKVYVSEKEKRAQLEQTNKQLRQYAEALSSTYKSKVDAERLRLKLSHYLSPSIVEDIIKNKKALVLGGEDREVTILFADIRGFTSITEKLPVRDIVYMLNEYFTLMTNIVFKYEGTVDKFMGDAIMAILGAPFSLDNDAVSAVRAAIEMQKVMREHKAEKERRGEIIFEIGIGINSGKVIAGNIGSDKTMSYTAIGDVVNVSSRIQGHAEGGQILIGERTRELIQDKFRVKELGKIALKNREKLETVFEVIGPSDNEG